MRKVSYEVLGEVRRLAKAFPPKVIAIVPGYWPEGAEDVSKTLAGYGADEIRILHHPFFEKYSSEGYSRVLADIARDSRSEILFLGATAMGKDLAPRVAARLGAGLISDAVSLHRDGPGIWTAVRPVYGGKVWATVQGVPSFQQVVTLRPNVFSSGAPDSSRTATVRRDDISLSPSTLRAVVKEILVSSESRAELTEAQIIVSGGRGLQGPENFKLIEELADALGASVGASRAVVDAGWKPHAFQVGLTGKTVTPTLYIACGISGAVQHLAGMSGSKTIVAINKDPNAPIFKVADYGIVGDLFEVIPLLTRELRKVRQG